MDAVVLNYPPAYIQQYVEKLIKDAQKDNLPQPNIDMLKDILSMVKVARSVIKLTTNPTNN